VIHFSHHLSLSMNISFTDASTAMIDTEPHVLGVRSTTVERPEVIHIPGTHDIVCTQDNYQYQNHRGNIVYKKVIESFVDKYIAANGNKVEIKTISLLIVTDLRTRYGLRFIEWVELSQSAARDKVRQALMVKANQKTSPGSADLSMTDDEDSVDNRDADNYNNDVAMVDTAATRNSDSSLSPRESDRSSRTCREDASTINSAVEFESIRSDDYCWEIFVANFTPERLDSIPELASNDLQ
jgi:hypothetical protein